MTLNQKRFLNALQTWLGDDRPHLRKREWIEAGGIKAYVRLTSRFLDGQMATTIEIATIEIPEKLRGKGTLKAAWEICLKHTDRHFCYAESVNNPRLLKYYEAPKNGWTADTGNPNCFFKPTNRK